MKRHWILSLLFLTLVVFSQTAAAVEPVSEIISVDSVRGVVTARDNRTGRTYSFKADAATMRTLKPGDAVDIDAQAGRVLSVAGVTRAYSVFEPDPAASCCGVVNLQPDPSEPVNEIVSARNEHTGALFQFSAPRQALAGLQVGSKIALDASGSYAMLQSAATSAGGKATYSFPVKPLAGTDAGKAVAQASGASGEDAEYWQITPNATLKGPTGRIVVDFPAPASVIFHVLGADYRQLAAWYEPGSGNFMPGAYVIKIWDAAYEGVPVKKNMDTRIKVGVLKLNIQEPYKILDPQGQAMFSGHPREKKAVVFPVGAYTLQTATLTERIEIKDRQVTEF